MYEVIGIFKILIGIFFLVISSWQDLKTREVSNVIWLIFAPIGFLLSLLQFFLNEDFAFLFSWLISFSVTTGLALIIFYTGFFGGADSKALIALALAFPFYPLSNIPVNIVINPIFPLTVLCNALISSLSVVFVLFFYNIFKLIETRGKFFKEIEGEPLWKKILILAIGLKIDFEKVNNNLLFIPLENFSENAKGEITRHLNFFIRFEETSEKFDMTNWKGKGKIWATIGLPFLVFVTIGFLVSLLIGDIMFLLFPQLNLF
jgi:preflagellin peptidase FlaK